MAGLQSAPRGLFAGQRRRTAVTIQGRFKQELGFDDIITGQEFSRPAKNLPAKWLVETVLISVSAAVGPGGQAAPLQGIEHACPCLHNSMAGLLEHIAKINACANEGSASHAQLPGGLSKTALGYVA